MIIIDRSLFLLCFLLFPLLIYFRHFWKKRGGRLPFSFSVYPRNLTKYIPRFFFLLFLSAHFFFWVALGFVILSLSGVSLVEKKKVYLSKGQDIMIVLDVSPSMGTYDSEKQNRLDIARDVISNFIRERENDAVGIVSFASEASLQVPPTIHYDHLINALDDIELYSQGEGTAIGTGLLFALLHLSSSNSQKKIIILLTDGANNEGEISPQMAAGVARERGVHLYSIGIGNTGPAPVELRNTRRQNVLRGIISDSFDEELLATISHMTHGGYFPARGIGGLEAVFQVIDSVESVQTITRTEVEKTDLSSVLIPLALALFLYNLLIRKILLREGMIW